LGAVSGTGSRGYFGSGKIRQQTLRPQKGERGKVRYSNPKSLNLDSQVNETTQQIGKNSGETGRKRLPILCGSKKAEKNMGAANL